MEFALKVALAIFFAKLIDPIAVLPAVVAGYFCRNWWQVVISAAAVGIVVEMSRSNVSSCAALWRTKNSAGLPNFAFPALKRAKF